MENAVDGFRIYTKTQVALEERLYSEPFKLK